MARFPYVVNFSPLQEDALVTLIDKVRKDVEKTLVRAEIILEQPMIDFLKENCKTEYGVRYVDELVRDRAIRAYMEAMSEQAEMFKKHILLITLSEENSYDISFRKMTKEEERLYDASVPDDIWLEGELADEFVEIDAMIHDGIKNQRFERLHLQ